MAAACKAHGKAFGGPTLGLEESKKRYAMGAQLLVNNSEFHSWSQSLKAGIAEFGEIE